MKTRHIYILWLLMVLVSLVLGSVAFLLLFRESRRIEDISNRLLSEKASAVVENLNLLVSETRDGLLDSLRAFPEENVSEALQSWPGTNTFVEESFVWDSRTGRLDYFGQSEARQGDLTARWTRPSTKKEVLPESMDQVSSRRPGRSQARATPVEAVPAPVPVEVAMDSNVVPSPQTFSLDEDSESLAVLGASNAVQARQKVRELTKDVYYEQRAVEEQKRARESAEMEALAANFNELAPSRAMPEADSALPDRRVDAFEVAATDDAVAGIFGESRFAEEEAETSGVAVATGATTGFMDVVTQTTAPSPTDPLPGQPLVNPLGDSGWEWISLGGSPQLVITYQPPFSSLLRGVVVDRETLLQTLESALPAGGVSLVLQNRVSASSRSYLNREPVFGEFDYVVQIPSAVFPGTSLVLRRVADDVFNFSFWMIAGLLVFILVASFFFGGSVFLWIARRTALEAQQKTDFLSNVSHELKTPLTTIRMYAEMLEEDRVSTPEKKKRYLQTIGGETQRLARLVNNILEFSALQKGKSRLNRREVSLSPQLKTIFESQQLRAAETGMTLQWEGPPSTPPVQADPDAVEQVLLNLIDNAIKYAGKGKTIQCRVRVSGGTLSIAVCDDGPGIPKDHQDRVFEPFHRVENDLTATKPGSGLGLSIARSLLRQMNGDLRYTPSPRGGACFTMTLPTHETP